MKRPAPERNTLHERRFTSKHSGSAIAAEVFMNHAGWDWSKTHSYGKSQIHTPRSVAIHPPSFALVLDRRLRRRRRLSGGRFMDQERERGRRSHFPDHNPRLVAPAPPRHAHV